MVEQTDEANARVCCLIFPAMLWSEAGSYIVLQTVLSCWIIYCTWDCFVLLDHISYLRLFCLAGVLYKLTPIQPLRLTYFQAVPLGMWVRVGTRSRAKTLTKLFEDAKELNVLKLQSQDLWTMCDWVLAVEHAPYWMRCSIESPLILLTRSSRSIFFTKDQINALVGQLAFCCFVCGLTSIALS